MKLVISSFMFRRLANGFSKHPKMMFASAASSQQTSLVPIGNSSQANPGNEEKKLKPCCACPETKRVRDACIIENGEENCRPLIEAHKECMRKMGFNI